MALFQKVDEFVVNRFYLTLMLYDLWKQKTIWEVAEKFQQPRGFIQNLLSSAASFASCVAHFCQVNNYVYPMLNINAYIALWVKFSADEIFFIFFPENRFLT